MQPTSYLYFFSGAAIIGGEGGAYFRGIMAR